MMSIINLLKNNQLIGSSLQLSGAQLFSYFSSFIAILLVGKFGSNGSIGLFAVFQSLVLIITSFSTLKAEYLFAKSPRSELDSISGNGLIISTTIVLVSSFVLALTTGLGLSQFQFIDMRIVFCILITSWVQSYLILAHHRNLVEKKITQIPIAKSTLFIVFSILVLCRKGALWPIYAFTFSSLLIGAALIFIDQSKFRFKQPLRFLLLNKSLFSNLSLSHIMDTLSLQALVIFIQYMYNTYSTGGYFISERISLFPSAIISSSIGALLYVKAEKHFRTRELKLKLFLNTYLVLLGIGMIVFGLGYLVIGHLLQYLLPPIELTVAIGLIGVCLFKGWVKFGTSPCSFGYILINQTHYNRNLSFLRLILYSLLSVVCFKASWNISSFILSIVMTEVGVTLIYHIIMVKLISKKLSSW